MPYFYNLLTKIRSGAGNQNRVPQGWGSGEQKQKRTLEILAKKHTLKIFCENKNANSMKNGLKDVLCTYVYVGLFVCCPRAGIYSVYYVGPNFQIVSVWPKYQSYVHRTQFRIDQ